MGRRFVPGTRYSEASLFTHQGSLWVATEATTSTPGTRELRGGSSSRRGMGTRRDQRDTAEVTAAIDTKLETLRRRFEDSLLLNEAAPDHLELLLDWNQERQRVWRDRALAEIGARLRDPSFWESLLTPASEPEVREWLLADPETPTE